MRAGHLSLRPQVGQEHGKTRRNITERRIAAGRVAGADEHRRVGDPVGHLVEQLTNGRRFARLDRHHAVEHVGQQAQLNQGGGREEPKGGGGVTGRGGKSTSGGDSGDHSRHGDGVGRDAADSQPVGDRLRRFSLALRQRPPLGCITVLAHRYFPQPIRNIPATRRTIPMI